MWPYQIYLQKSSVMLCFLIHCNMLLAVHTKDYICSTAGVRDHINTVATNKHNFWNHTKRETFLVDSSLSRARMCTTSPTNIWEKLHLFNGCCG